jgi:Uma2 family endonuclease
MTDTRLFTKAIILACGLYAESGVAEYWVVDIRGSRIHVMSQSDGKHHRSIEIVVSPNPLAPKCHPNATLNTSELFEVTGN